MPLYKPVNPNFSMKQLRISLSLGKLKFLKYFLQFLDSDLLFFSHVLYNLSSFLSHNAKYTTRIILV